MVTIDIEDIEPNQKALVFGASAEPGASVVEGLLASGFEVYCASRHIQLMDDLALAHGKCHLIEVDLDDNISIRSALAKTDASSIFLVTTTDFSYPVDSTFNCKSRSCKEAEDLEYDTICRFFDILVGIYREDHIPRHIVFSTQDNVKAINGTEDSKHFIRPLEDGSVVPHFTGKGRASEYAMDLLKQIPDLSITLLTLPFSHSNFLASTIPLPNEAMNEWAMNVCFGDAAIDMFSVSDLQYVIPAIFQNKILYDGFNVRLSAERITMDEVASIFSELFGKDVIYNPLTFDEMSELDIPGAQVFSQMCQYLVNPCSRNDIDVTATIMSPRKPQLFRDWLVTHSDHVAFEKVGLSNDDCDKITCVAVFDATSMQGISVIQALLSDKKENYSIRAVVSDVKDARAQALQLLNPSKVTLIQVDWSIYSSCLQAVSGAHGVFLVTSFDNFTSDPILEEHHARNVIDASQECHTVKHLILSTFEDIDDLNEELKNEDGKITSDFDAKVRAAAYARSKSISSTYLLVPVYSEEIFKMTLPELLIDSNTGEENRFFSVPEGDESTRISCLNGQDLGAAVVRIFQSYELYAGHEIALISDIISVTEAQEIIEQVFFTEEESKGQGGKLDRVTMVKDDWLKSKSHVKDLGRIFQFVSKSDVVKHRRALAKTMELVPDARPLKRWLEQNRENVQFRSMLGLR